MSKYTVRKHKNGTYYYDVHHESVGRKRKYGFKTKKDANAKAIALLKEIDQQNTIDKEILFVDYFDTWLEVNKSRLVGDKQLDWYERSRNLIVAKYGKNKRLNTITKNDIQLVLNEYGEGRTKESVRKVKNCLTAPFKDAVYEGYIPKDPTYKLVCVGTKPSKRNEDKYLSIEEYLQLIEFFKSKNERSYVLLFVMAITGGRYSDVNHMTLKDLHYAPGKIWLPGTKTITSPRAVSVNAQDFLHIKTALSKTPQKMNGKLFDISNSAITKVFKKGLEIIGADSTYTVYALRHTHASFLIANDFDITYISKRLGHSTPNTTLATYSHLLDERSDEQDKKLATIWRQ